MYMALQMLLFRMLVLVMMCSVLNALARASNVISNSCPADCGNNVSIPYPFGIGKGCYVGYWFKIVCRNDSYDLGFPKPFLKMFNLEVLEIDLVGKVRVNYTMFSSSKNHLELQKSPFIFSENNNSFVVMGCNNSASLGMRSLLDDSISFSGCESPCNRAPDPFTNGSRSCKDTNCCQTTIPSNLHAFTTTIEPKSSNESSSCNYAFLVDQDWFENNFTELNPNMSVPVVLDWGLDYTSFLSLPTKNSTSYCYRSYPTFSCQC